MMLTVFICTVALVFAVIVVGTASDGFNDSLSAVLSGVMCVLIFACGYFVGVVP